MDLQLFPTKALFFVIVIVFLVHIPTPVIAVDEHYTECSIPFHCAGIQNIGYPFWGTDRPEYCGYPGFYLNCSGEAPEITIVGLTYRVIHIYNVSQALVVARTDYWNGICPAKLANTTLDLTLFENTPDNHNFTLFYGCPIIGSQYWNTTGLSNRFDCGANYIGDDDDDDDSPGYYLTTNLTSTVLPEIAAAIYGYLESCDRRVIVTGYQLAVQSLGSNPTADNLIVALKDGFGLRWNANNDLCKACASSGGFCGHNQGSGEFICYCQDQPYTSRCPGTDQNSSSVPPKEPSGNGLKIGLATAGAAIGLILLGGCFFLIYRRRKKIADQSKSRDLPIPPASKGPVIATSLSQNMPSYLYSKPDFERSCYFGAQVFSYAELEEATGNFDSSKELGDGGFGTVYFGLLKDGRAVAVKRLYEHNLKRVEQFINEVKILTGLRHQNLVMLYGCTSRHSRELLLVYEYIPNGTVADHLHGNRANSGLLTWPVRLNIAIETASALTYLHGRDVIHRDVKSNNILLDNSFRVKVADFGLSRFFPNNVTHVSTAPQGTPGYVDPEYYQCYQLTNKSDVYSFGVVLIELISSKEAVDINRNRYDINLANMAISRIQNHALNELVDPNLGFEHDISVRRAITSVAELAFQCLQQERDMRPSMDEVLETLQGIQSEELQALKAEVVDIGADHVGLLKDTPPPLSPDSVMTDRWVSSSTLSSSSA